MAFIRKSKTAKQEPEQAKREEVKTYKALGLDRIAKSRARREKLASKGAFRIIGGNEPDRPALRVTAQRLREIYADVSEEILAPFINQKIENADKVIRSLRPKIDREVYDRMAAEIQIQARLEMSSSSEKRMAPQTFAAVARDMAQDNQNRVDSYAAYRGGLVDDLISRMKDKQKNNPKRFQSAWVQVVGPAASTSTWLDRIENGIAYFRCTNPVLGYEIQRNPRYPKLLTTALQLPVRQLRMG